ncbi:elongation factor P 5-aminopentanone reductase [Bacillus sp. FJAT-45037]|uniref:elongation factor P 5-aminopentanone reductase n=1 Tax=Bacillus sp. FJAT-45037 TaxID=2011007 RepID=UPI000C237B1F|nr:SDR family NAD(P)-dependent oxidoreductase [Bacillus sp. FJAT-45037]
MKRILITGASRGIGAAIAKELASPGCALFLHYYTNEEAVLAVGKDCLKQGADDVHYVQADLSMREGASQLLQQVFAPVDIVIHCGGMSLSQLFTDLTDHELDQMMNLYVANPIKITRKLLPHMIREKKGKVIAISSIWGVTGGACEVAYSAAKGGLNSFIKSLAKEVAISNIQVNAVAPGAILTDMMKSYSQVDLNDLCDEIPAGVFGTPEDIAHAVAFLASEKSNYINGQILSINGAWNC